ncbi:MAG: ATP-binding cassette domain-containing protein [Eubacterium sp.]|nr:ATP-binding cassette domain-containing protein [Eubacterium sp.]
MGIPIIEIKNLGKTFSTKNGEVRALDDINISINKGDIYGIIGMSGAGKSTLVRCMNLLEKPTEGSVWIDGQNILEMSEKELRKVRYATGMIFQQFNLLEQRTAERNILFALEIAGHDKTKAKARAKELLELVGLSDRADSYPSQLSGGQKQRVAIARALANNPKVLLCDEATSALDPTTTRSILELLKDINRRLGITIVVITHEMSVVEEICSHVAIIDKSHIAEQGSVEEIFTNPKTEIAKRMIYPDGETLTAHVGDRCLRIVFDGSSSYDPVVAKMILDCRAMVNILYADMKNIDGTARGQMVIQLPEDETTAAKVLSYLKNNGLTVEEVNNDGSI